RHTEFQPSTNPLNNPTPSKWLAPTRQKSDKMFFQMVTHSFLKSFMMSIEIVFAPLPCYYGLSAE
ncbi:MAG: hypothetical protein ABI970_24940, partial [Chloroflexota bacterium]